MTPINNRILITFEDYKHIIAGGIELHIPERYIIQEDDGDGSGTAWGVTTDRRRINPQVVNVVSGNEEIPTGSKCFVHYGAYEVCTWVDDNVELKDRKALIPAAMVLFLLDPIKPLPGMYLGEQVFVEGLKTESGIYITPYAEKKEACNVKITHVPDDSKIIKVGDEVITVDAAQYELHYEGKNFIKLKESEIIGIIRNGEVFPLGNCLLVDYLPDDDLQERIAENNRRSESRDIAIKYNLKLTSIDFEPLKEPKTVKAKLLAVNIDELKWVETILIERNKGCILSDGRWIISADAMIGVMA